MTDPDLDRIFKAYDVRGVVPDDLDANIVRRIGAAFAAWTKLPAILLGRDSRISSPELAAAITEGATSVGVDVVDLGLASTDLVYFASGSLDLPAVMLTASHNPKDYNGLKFCMPGARPVGEDTGLREIRALVERDDLPAATMEGTVSHRDLLEPYTEHVLSFVDAAAMRPLTVAVDTANGMGGLVVPAVMARLPVTLHHLYAELDGTFPNHPADPLDPENQKDLKATVLEQHADVGLAFDGDADRVFLVDEKAEDVSGSLLTALVARAMLRQEPGAKIVHNLICSWIVPESIRAEGGVPIRTRVGHSFIKQVMAETGAIFGGEHSGHYYFRKNYRADSGLIAAVVALGELSSADAPLSNVLAPFRKYFDSGEINSPVDDPLARIERIGVELADGRQDRLDGLTVEYPDWWCNVRPSNTEPLLRLNVEATTEELLARKTAMMLDLIRS
ncbi:MAG: phosphomannomutase/phosphoglucomutase [Actinobacteria bacterium]|nr:MAG: phosphomannomutase/phosphoglucomutase [Actinomycetota bacterium]TMK20372.1 MAG: phosphomannomutase/phosphoglucomutase [Actinomycetota bacterium]TMK92091.1 MAG: phosphomannomutase/phosphoglucomutase [Actinomycetota bacterium]TMM22570.1 MAG: phosphomannomutase/phosphoglucomutase [Actinomycetota bacterium]